MKSIKFLPFLGLLFFAISTNNIMSFSPQQMAEKVCCRLFGNEDASKDIKEKMQEAHVAFDLVTDNMPVKYINTATWFGTLLDQLDSFTWFGTWFNKESWENKTETEKKWSATHEAAHTKQKHPSKLICVTAVTLVASSLLAKVIVPNMGVKILPALITIGIAGAATGLVAIQFSKKFEQEADIAAAKKLIAQGKKDVVEHYLNQLKEISDHETSGSMWFQSIQNQIDYLQAVVN